MNLGTAAQYYMRLLPSAAAWIEKVLTSALPADFDPSQTISLPMRESLDKCGAESECFGSFEPYSKLLEKLRAEDPSLRNVIITSDNAGILAEARNWSLLQGERWRAIFNPLDSGAGTGYWSKEKRKEGDPAQFVLTFLSTLHLQLRGRYFILNGNSHFHNLIGDLVASGGCRFVPSPQFYWLHRVQTRGDNSFLLCSGFKALADKTPVCSARFAQREKCKQQWKKKPGTTCWQRRDCGPNCEDV